MRERDERLRGRFVLIPVILVERPDQSEIDLERRIPRHEIVGLSNTRKVGRQGAVVGRTGDRHDLGDLYFRFTGHETALVLPDVVTQFEGVTHLGLEIIGRPLVQHHA